MPPPAESGWKTGRGGAVGATTRTLGAPIAGSNQGRTEPPSGNRLTRVRKENHAPVERWLTAKQRVTRISVAGPGARSEDAADTFRHRPAEWARKCRPALEAYNTTGQNRQSRSSPRLAPGELAHQLLLIPPIVPVADAHHDSRASPSPSSQRARRRRAIRWQKRRSSWRTGRWPGRTARPGPSSDVESGTSPDKRRSPRSRVATYRRSSG